jgi:hypothetical protein
MVRPPGVGRADATYEIPIEGRDEARCGEVHPRLPRGDRHLTAQLTGPKTSASHTRRR